MAVGAAAAGAAAGGAVLAACQPKTVIVEKEKVVRQTVEQIVTREVEVEVTQEVVHEVTRVIEVKKLVTPTAVPSRYQESPLDAAQVAAGKLSPVDERMPAEPLVIVPYEEIGRYGGRMRTGAVGTGLRDGDAVMISPYENPLRLTPNLRGAVPNLLKEWQVSADFKVITGTLRRGVKWSDGEPLTIDDFMFAWEDVQSNRELYPVMQTPFQPGGKPMVVESSTTMPFASPLPCPPHRSSR